MVQWEADDLSVEGEVILGQIWKRIKSGAIAIGQYLWDCGRDGIRPFLVGHYKREAFQVTRFVPNGVLVTVVQSLLASPILVLWGRDGTGETALVASLIGWIPGFYLHRTNTFSSSRMSGAQRAREQFYWYSLLKLWNLLYQWGVLGIGFALWRVNWALVLLALIPCWNYPLKRWIFRQQSPLQLCRMMHDIIMRYICTSPTMMRLLYSLSQ